MWLPSHGQPKSAIQFYDTTTTQPTAKIGWTGTASNGKFFIQMPNNQQITDSSGDVTITGRVTATQFNGSGAGLTNVTPSNHAHPESDITGLTGDLGKKADTATVMPLIRSKADAGSVGITAQAVSDSLKRKADTTKVNQLFSGAQNNQVWKKTAGGYGWANDSVGVAKIIEGSSISINPSSGIGSVTVAVANGSIDSTKIANMAISDNNIASISGIKVSSGISAYNITSGVLDPLFIRTDFSGQWVRIGGGTLQFSHGSGGLPVFGMYVAGTTNKFLETFTWKDDGSGNPTYDCPILRIYHDTKELQCSGNITANAFSCPSDARLKMNIRPLTNSLEKLLILKGVRFEWDPNKHWVDSNSSKEEIGFIAQDVEKIIPEVVHTDAEGYKSLSYDKLTAVLVEGIKEQQAIIAQLQQENVEMKAKVDKMAKNLNIE
jgi:hypothetical protein